MNLEKKDRKRERKGFMKARDFRALARQALSGRWGVAVLTGFLAALLGGTMASSGSSGSGGSSVGSSAGEFIQSSGGHYEIPDFVWTALIIFGTLLSIYALVCFIIGGTVQLGYAKFNLALIGSQGRAGFRPVFAVSPLRRRLSAVAADCNLCYPVDAASDHPWHHRGLQLRHGALYSL